MLVLGGMAGRASAQTATDPEFARATGLRPPTAADKAWMDLNLANTRRVLPNALGLERLNRQRREKGLTDLKADTVPVGAESQSTSPAAFAGGMDLPGSDDGKGAVGAVPAAVDNSLLPSFPPVRSQGSIGSCAAFSTTYYAGTHMLGLARGWNNRDVADNSRKLSPKWTYNFANGGEDKGAWFTAIMDVLMKLGCPAWSDFPYVGDNAAPANYLEWSRDAAVWRGAVANRFQQIGRVQALDTAAGLANAKALLANGYAILYATHVSSWQFMPLGDDPSTTADNALAGRQCCWKVSALANSGHAMTLVGYNDDVWLDINKNGAVDAGEKGALKVVNSWGTTSWWEAGPDGFGWIAYDALKASSAVAGVSSSDRQSAFWNSEVYWITARASYTPTLLGQFTLTSATRDQLGLKVGTSATSTTTPQSYFPTTTSFGWANDADSWPQAWEGLGGAYGFAGAAAAVNGTFVLDLTDLAQSGLRRYYVAVQDKRAGSAATLSDFRVVTPAGTVLATASAGIPGTAENSTARAYVDFNVNAAPVINSATTATGTVGESFTYTITATNSPTSFGASGLPPGLVVNSGTGAITGNPTVAGAGYVVALSAANAGGVGSGTVTVTIVTPLIAAPTITSADTASATVGVPFSYTITASGSPTSFGASGLPPGLTVNTSTGALSGTPTLAGAHTVTLSAANAGGTGTDTLNLTVAAAAATAPVITSSSTATGVSSSDFVYRIEATNSPTSFGAAGLPGSLHIATLTGTITGTLPGAGSYPITLSASNAAGSGYRVLLLTVTGSSIYGPPNDAFANRIPLSGISISATGTNSNASAEGGEPPHYGTGAASRSVWWTWTAPTNGLVVIATTGSDFDTLLGVYTGSTVDALTLMANDDDSGGGSASRVSFSAVAGTIYQIAVDGLGGAEGQIALALAQTAGAGPANDAFANRIALSGTTAAGSGANQAATAEPGEPAHAGYAASCSVWWTWTAPAAGQVIVDTIGSDFDTLLGVYTGNAVNALTLVAADDQGGGNNTSQATFTATAGTAYRIAVDGWHGETGGVQLHLALLDAAPANDHFANRLTLSGASAAASGSTLNATAETGEPAHAGYGARSSVWWNWTAPATGVVRCNTEGSDFDTLLAVYTGATLAGLAPLAADDDSGAGTSSSLTFYATAGTPYRIAVDGYGGATGSVALHLLLNTGSSNDDFADRIALVGSSVSFTGGNADATAETAEPAHGGYSAVASVWWTWTAPGSGMVTITTAGSSFDTVLAVYQGSALADLTAVVANDDAGLDLTSEVSFYASAGSLYQIAVDGYGGAEGSIELGLGQNASSVLYSTDFEDFPTGIGALAGFDGWRSTDDPDAGTYGVYAADSQAAWVGYAYTTADAVYAFRPMNYNPIAAGTPVIRFSVDLAVYDSSMELYDYFGFALFNTDNDYLAEILLDNSNLTVWSHNGDAWTRVGSFANNEVLRLEVRMDFAGNRWSATLGGTALFADQVLHVGSEALTLGDMDAFWQISAAGDPGDNVMAFDNYKLESDGPPLIVTTSPLPNAAAGTAYELALAASGGTEPYTWSIAAGSLPTDLHLGGDGVIRGTPGAATTANFTVRVTGNNGLSSTKSFSLTVAPASTAPTITTTSPLPSATAGVAYSVTLAASGGTTPYTWALAAGGLPADLHLGSDGVIRGTPEAAATASFTARVTGNNGLSSTKSFSLTVGSVTSGRDFSQDCYLAGTTVDVSVTVDLSTLTGLTSLALTEVLPAGWQYQDVVGETVPDIVQFRSATHTVEFSWAFSFPASPFTLTYRVLIPALTANGEYCFTGTLAYRTSGDETTLPTGGELCLDVGGCCVPHQTDRNGDWQIQLAPELTRLVQFYNLRGYHYRAGTEDGYDPGAGSQTGAPHQADQNGDWQIQLSPELTRMIQFYNSGGYRCADGTEDGYTPISKGAKTAAKAGSLAASRSLAYPTASDAVVEVTLTLQPSTPAALTSLMVQEKLPPGWQFVELRGRDLPAIAPRPGATGQLEFAWVTLPSEWPATLTYRLARLATAKGDLTIGGRAGFREDGDDIMVALPATPIDAAATVIFLAGPHGRLEGTTEQTVAVGADALPVTALADPGYTFDHWSDGATTNPRTLRGVAADLTLTATFRPAARVAPEGEFTACVDGLDGTVGREWWDLTGTYTTQIDGKSLLLNMLHDSDGKLTGTAAYRVAPDTLITMPIRGRVADAADGVVAQLALVGADAARTVAVCLALDLTVDRAGARLVGPLTGSVSAAGVTTPLNAVVALALPVPMDGTWTLRFQLAPAGKAVTGTALLTLSNGVGYAFVASGRLSGEAVVLALSGAPADPAAKGFRLRATITPLAGGWARLESFSALGYGQALAW
jgi:C1A family cysteine protease